MRKILSVVLIVTMLLTIFAYTVNAQAFTDVPTTHKYYTAITTLVDIGIINGYGDGIFRPDNSLTRAEMGKLTCTIFGYSYSSSTINPFTDIDTYHWAWSYVRGLLNAAVIVPDGTKLFRPNDNITYIEALEWVITALGFKQDAINAGGLPDGYKIVALSKGLLTNISISNNNQTLTRGDVSQLLYNAIKPKIDDATGTQISGIIAADTVWTKANSPYRIMGNTLIDEGATLTIEPDVEIIARGDFYIQVRGNMQAIGTESLPIKFSAAFGNWRGINFRSDNNVLEYCDITRNLTFENSHNNRILNCFLTGLRFGNASNVTTSNNNVIQYSIIDGGGINFDYTYGNEILGNVITNCQTGIYLSVNSSATLIRNTIESNNVGIYFMRASAQIKYNNIINNNIGIDIDGWGGWGGWNNTINASYNNFDNIEYNVKNISSTDQPYLINNFWGATNKSTISAKIYDFYKDFNFDLGKVIFEPFLTNPVDITISLMEYTINAVTLITIENEALPAIPSSGDFQVYVNLFKNEVRSGDVIIIALYDNNCRLLRMYQDKDYLTSIPTDASTNFSQLVSQVDGKTISRIRVFIWGGLNTMTPLSNIGNYGT